MFKDLSDDIRSTKYDPILVDSFNKRAEEFFPKFKKYSMGMCTSRKPYLHLLRDHIGDFMKFWGVSLNWGYGYFNCNGSKI